MHQTILIVGDRVIPPEEISRYALCWHFGKPYLTFDNRRVDAVWTLTAGHNPSPSERRIQCDEDLLDDEEDAVTQQDVA